MKTVALIIVLQFIVTLLTGCSQFEEQLEEIPETVEQLKKDTKEIYNGVQTVNNSLWSQTILLKSVLEKLREARNGR